LFSATVKALFRYVLIGLFATSFASAQERPLYNTNLADTSKILALIKEGNSLQKTNSDSSISDLKSALQQSQNLNYTNGIASALLYLGMDYISLGDENTSLAYFLQALPYAQRCSYNKELMATLYTGMGTPYLRKQNYSEAGYYYYKALQEVRNNNLEYAPIACKLYSNISSFWAAVGQHIYTKQYLVKAEKIALHNKDTIALIAIYGNIGAMYDDENNDVKDYEYMTRALGLAEKKHFTSYEQMALTNIGIIFRYRNQPLKAIPYFLKAISLADDDHGYQHNLGAYYNLSFAYFEAGFYEKAKKYVYPSLQKAERLHIDEAEHGNAMLILSNIYQKEKNYKDAVYWLNKFIAYTDTDRTRAKDINLNRLEANYQLSEKDRIIAQKQLQLSQNEVQIKNKNIWIIGITAAILLLSISSISLYLLSKHKQRAQAARIRNLEQLKELGHLKAMLEGEEKERTRLARELHDGIGGMLAAAKLNLGSIRGEHQELGGIAELDGVLQLLNDTAVEVRQTAHNLMPDVLMKHDLREALLFYCANINSNNQLDIDLQFHGAFDQLSKSVELILYRITQELIQNIIKHANATQAVIQIIQDKGRLNLIIEDNGTGFDVQNKNKGAGMQNLQFRVQALQGYISITSLEGSGTSVYIEFDLEKLKMV
jgi:signal transduction histidine kinase